MPDPVPTTRLAGLDIVCLSREELARQLVHDYRIQKSSSRPLPAKLVFSVNGQGLALTATEPGYKGLMHRADYLHADGQSIVFASRWLTHRPIPERSATTDFFHDAAKVAEEHGITFYMLGGTPQSNAAAVRKIRHLHPLLKIAGAHHGYEPNPDTYVDLIRAAAPDVVWLAFGKPRQEVLAARLQASLAGPTWIKPCGGLYEFLADATGARRAPRLLQNLGLEWLHRTCLEPRRLLWRYVSTNAVAIWLLIGIYLEEKFAKFVEADLSPMDAGTNKRPLP